MDFLSTVEGSLCESFFPKGWAYNAPMAEPSIRRREEVLCFDIFDVARSIK